MKTLLGGLPATFGLPIAIVQHRGTDPHEELAGSLQPFSPLPVQEVEDKEPIRGGTVYLAPPGYHLLIEGRSFALSTEAPIHFARPSIDVLFETAALAFRERVIAIALTASSRDGAAGIAKLKECRALVIVQDPTDAESPTLGRAVLAQTPVDYVLPLKEIAPLLTRVAVSAPLVQDSARPGRP
ncbi:MAG TPA: chemotaxis protein CheB [Chloroflexota bacterium]